MAERSSDKNLGNSRVKIEAIVCGRLSAIPRVKKEVDKSLNKDERPDLLRKKRERPGGSADLSEPAKNPKNGAAHSRLSESPTNKTIGELHALTRALGKNPDSERKRKQPIIQFGGTKTFSLVNSKLEGLVKSKAALKTQVIEHQASLTKILYSKHKKRANSSVSSIQNKLEQEYERMPNVATTQAYLIDSGSHQQSNTNESLGSPPVHHLKLRSREESSKERAQINEIIKKRLELNSSQLLKHEDNETYIRRMKQTLKNNLLPGTPSKPAASTPLSKQSYPVKFALRALERPDTKISEPEIIEWSWKPERPKNRSLDANEASPKVNSFHKRQVSVNKVLDVGKSRTKAGLGEKSAGTKSMLKSFLDLVSVKPYDLLNNSKPSPAPITPCIYESPGQASPQSKEAKSGQWSSKAPQTRAFDMQGQCSPVTSKGPLKTAMPASCRGDNTYLSLFQSQAGKRLVKHSEKIASLFKVSDTKETLEASPTHKLQLKLASTGESISKMHRREKTSVKQIATKISEEKDLANLELPSSMLQIEFRLALTLSMNATDPLSLVRNIDRVREIYEYYLRSQDVYELLRLYFDACQTRGVLSLEVIFLN